MSFELAVFFTTILTLLIAGLVHGLILVPAELDRERVNSEQARVDVAEAAVAELRSKIAAATPSERVQMVRKLLLDKADELKTVKNAWDGSAWMQGAHSLVSGLITREFAIQSDFKPYYPSGFFAGAEEGFKLLPREKQWLEHAASTLRVMAAKLKEEHLKN